MNLKKYEAFVKTYELGSISAAAYSLHSTQSGLTQLIASLEKELGIILFTRSRNGIRLTPEGETLLPLVQEVLAADERLTHAVHTLSEHRDSIRIAAFKSVAVNWLPEIIREFRKVEPDLRIELADAGYNNMEVSLSEQQIDFGFVPLPVSDRYQAIPIFKDRLLAVLPPDHPGAALTACPVSLFATEPVISLSESIDLDARTVFRDAGITPDIRYRVEDDYAMLAMVAQGLGISIVPELILTGTDMNVCVRELDPPSFRTIGIAFPSGKILSPDARRFADFVADFIRSRTNSSCIYNKRGLS